MGSGYSTNAENALKKYIDSNCHNDKDSLQLQLFLTTKEGRYKLMMDVRGNNNINTTGLLVASHGNDLKTIEYMLHQFTSSQKCAVIEITSSDGNTALHYAALNGSSSIITYIMSNVSEEEKFRILALQNEKEDTALHCAASQQQPGVVEAILTVLSLPQQVQLLNIQNQQGQTAVALRPDIQEEIPPLTKHGKFITT